MKKKLLAGRRLGGGWGGVVAVLLWPLSGATLAGNGPLWLQGGHAARISGVVCSPDGSMIASASDDATVKLWATNGTLLRTLSTQPYAATAVAFSPDGTKIAAGTYYGGYAYGSVNRSGYDNIPGLGEVYLWQAPNGWTATNVSLLRVLTNRYGKITSLAFSADSKLLASGNAAGSNYVNLVSDGTLVTTRGGYDTVVGPAAVTGVAFSSGGLLASGCEDRTIRVWNSSWSHVWTTNSAHTSNVTAVAFSPNGGLLASASLDQTIRIWSTTNWTCLRTLTGHTNGVTGIAFSPDGKQIASGGGDGTVKFWDWIGGTCLTTIASHFAPVTSITFSLDGNLVISGGEDSTVRAWLAASGDPVLTFGGQPDYVSVVAVSPDGTLCASAGGDQTIQVRNLINGSLVRTLPGHTGSVSAIAFSPASAVLASGGGPLDPTIKLWRLSDGTLQRSISANTNGIMALAFSPAGTMLAAGGDCTEQTIQLWNVSDGALLRTLDGHTNGVTALAFSVRGDLLVSGGRRFDNTIKIWTVANGSLAQSFSGHANNIEAVAFAPDGKSVASGSSGASALRIWQLSDGSYRDFGNDTNPVFSVAFAPAGSTLASADQNTIKLWDVTTGTLSETITNETFRVSCCAYSPNGNLLLYGREDATVALTANTLGALGQPPLTFTSFAVGSDGATSMEAIVQPWTHYVMQFSANLSNWDFLSLAFSESNSLSIPGPATSNANVRLYRALTPP